MFSTFENTEKANVIVICYFFRPFNIGIVILNFQNHWYFWKCFQLLEWLGADCDQLQWDNSNQIKNQRDIQIEEIRSTCEDIFSFLEQKSYNFVKKYI